VSFRIKKRGGQALDYGAGVLGGTKISSLIQGPPRKRSKKWEKGKKIEGLGGIPGKKKKREKKKFGEVRISARAILCKRN